MNSNTNKIIIPQIIADEKNRHMSLKHVLIIGVMSVLLFFLLLEEAYFKFEIKI